MFWLGFIVGTLCTVVAMGIIAGGRIEQLKHNEKRN